MKIVAHIILSIIIPFVVIVPPLSLLLCVWERNVIRVLGLD